MNPKVRNRSQTFHARGGSQKCANLCYTLQWELLDDVQPFGQIKFQFPPFFPKKITQPKLPMLESSETKTFTIQLNIDDALTENLLKLPFIHVIRFPCDPNPSKCSFNNSGPIKTSSKNHLKSSHKNISECYLPEYLQIDCKQLLIPRHTEISYKCAPTGYKFFSFNLQVDRSLVDSFAIKKYSPVFIWFKSINNMPDVPYKQSELEENYGPVYYKLTIHNETYILRPQSHSTRLSIDTYFSVLPRVQTNLYFEVHDRDTSLANFSNCIGTGLILPCKKEQDPIKCLYLDANSLIQPHITTKTSFGFCNFPLLPARKIHIGIHPSKEACVVSPGNFFESQTELSVTIIDPIEDVNNNFIPDSSILNQVSPKTKGVPNVPQLKNFQNLPFTPSPKNKVLTRRKTNTQLVEDNTTQYNRWIITSGNNTKTIIDQIQKAIDEYHMNQFDEKSISILKTYNYEKGLTKTIDLITGFCIITPEESFLIVESRISGNATDMLFDLLQQYSKRGYHVLFDIETQFPFPRLYSGFDSLIKPVSIPLSVSHLLRIDGLYFHNSINSILFSIVQKLNYLLSCTSIKTADKCDFFPTTTEILQLLSKAEILISIPLQKGIPTFSEPIKTHKIMSSSCSSNQILMKFKNDSTNSSLSSSKDCNIGSTDINENDHEIVQLKPENSVVKSTRTYNERNKTSLSYYSRNHEIKTARTPRRRFEPYGKKKEEIVMTPRKRIGCTDNGDEEIWIVNNLNEIPDEEGWEVEVIGNSGKNISTSDYKNFDGTEHNMRIGQKKRTSMILMANQIMNHKKFKS